MDPSAAPWRVLQEVAAPADLLPAGTDHGSGRPTARLSIPRSTLLIGGSAAALALVAFALAFGSGSAGGVAIDGGAAFGSGRPAASGSADPSGLAAGRVQVVEVVGAVARPGVYRLAAGSRVGDLVAAAGGYGPRVDADRAGRELNLAALLHDGDQIRVPSRDDTATTHAPGGAGPGPAGSAAAKTPIDLNRATASELDILPGSARPRPPRSSPLARSSHSSRSSICRHGSSSAPRDSRS